MKDRIKAIVDQLLQNAIGSASAIYHRLQMQEAERQLASQTADPVALLNEISPQLDAVIESLGCDAGQYDLQVDDENHIVQIVIIAQRSADVKKKMH